ncbi:MAG TPA: PLP-dependent aminotransferase family protein [Acidimicrobiales bacterium]|mgnify:FL=1|nr:PLP-dependent aminotransferase family protein [Acidimicrobiales bacterium]
MQPIEAVLGRWSDGPGPLHRKLADALRTAVEQGRIPAGERLPSERELARRLAVSRSTVVTAYGHLRSEGLLESRQGSGTRVRAQVSGPPPYVHELPVSPVYRTLIDVRSDVISLAAAIFPAHPRVAEVAARVMAEDGEKLLAQGGYLPAGLPALREALAERYTEQGLPTSPDQIVVTTGAQQAVSLAAQLFVGPRDQVVVESPSFSGTLDIIRARGARVVEVPVDGGGVDVRGVARIVTQDHPVLVYLMPSFHNPTGAMLAANRRRDLAELVAETRVPLVEDNALENAPLDDDWLPPIAAYAPADAPVLSAGSFSKAAWGGLRVGWLRGPVELVDRVVELKAMNDLGSPLFDQALAARLVPHLDEMRADHRDMLNRNLALVSRLLTDLLPDWRWSRPKGGPSLWVELPEGSASAFTQVALRYGVEVIPGDQMSATGAGERKLRLPFSADPPVLEETLLRLARAWEAYAPQRQQAPSPSRPVVV